jgi:hypothetical protein
MQGIDCVHGAKMQISVGEGPPTVPSHSTANLCKYNSHTASKHLLVHQSPQDFIFSQYMIEESI